MAELQDEITQAIAPLQKKLEAMRSELITKRDSLRDELAAVDLQLEELDRSMSKALGDALREMGLPVDASTKTASSRRKRKGNVPVGAAILIALLKHGGRMTTQQINGAVPDAKPSTINVARGKMQAEGLVSKKPHPEGKRGSLYALTAKGKKAAEALG